MQGGVWTVQKVYGLEWKKGFNRCSLIFYLLTVTVCTVNWSLCLLIGDNESKAFTYEVDPILTILCIYNLYPRLFHKQRKCLKNEVCYFILLNSNNYEQCPALHGTRFCVSSISLACPPFSPSTSSTLPCFFLLTFLSPSTLLSLSGSPPSSSNSDFPLSPLSPSCLSRYLFSTLFMTLLIFLLFFYSSPLFIPLAIHTLSFTSSFLSHHFPLPPLSSPTPFLSHPFLLSLFSSPTSFFSHLFSLPPLFSPYLSPFLSLFRPVSQALTRPNKNGIVRLWFQKSINIMRIHQQQPNMKAQLMMTSSWVTAPFLLNTRVTRWRTNILSWIKLLYLPMCINMAMVYGPIFMFTPCS